MVIVIIIIIIIQTRGIYQSSSTLSWPMTTLTLEYDKDARAYDMHACHQSCDVDKYLWCVCVFSHTQMATVCTNAGSGLGETNVDIV